MAVDESKIKKIQERYLDLPEDVQKALFSTQTSDAIFEVGKKHGLVIDKMGELADETGLVMLGMTKPSEYIKNLENRLGVPVLKAKEIAEDINQKVFSPIRESLKKIHGIIATKEQDLSPNNLPVEPPLKEKITLPQIPTIAVPQKIVMPPQPDDIKIGEIAKEVESKVEIKPLISGRIERTSEKDEGDSVIQNGKETVPDIFLKKIPIEKPKIEPDFIPPKKEPEPKESKETKNTLEKELVESQKPTLLKQSNHKNNDPYREPI